MASTIFLSGTYGSAPNNMTSLRWFAVPAAIWMALAMLFAIAKPGVGLPQYIFLTQDVPVAAAMIGFLMLVRLSGQTTRTQLLIQPRILTAAMLAMAGIAWIGHYWLMQGYEFSRDEDLARLAASYIARGDLGIAIPPEWRAFHGAMLPEFQHPIGGDRYWISIYLPGSALIEALVSQVADPALSQPLLLLIGLAALWQVSKVLLPDRPDSRIIVMLLALTSSQLLFNAMTPYAMTAHFALNLLWLALFVADRPLAHAGAILVGALALGLHKVQFHALFAGPVLIILLYQRRWLLSAIYAISYSIFIIFWLKLYPLMLAHILDLPPSAAGSKNLSISPRLYSLDPLIYIPRFFAWNNVLLLPLALLGAWGAAKDVRKNKIATYPNLLFLALAAGCATGMLLTVHQGFGWGYRYLHGYIGPFCLLAGRGWSSRPVALSSIRPVLQSCLLALILMIVQAAIIYRFATPHARAHADIVARKTDVVLVDARGSVFGQDVVRIDGRMSHKPVIMSMAHLDPATVPNLCRRYKVEVFDRAGFARVGVKGADMEPSSTTKRMDMIQNYLARTGCVS
ncbi:MFS transporter [Sphingobium sp. MK2]